MVEKISNAARPKAGIKIIENLGAFFGERVSSASWTGTLHATMPATRSQSAARRGLWKPWLRGPSSTTSRLVVGQHAVSPGAAGWVASPAERVVTRDKPLGLVLAAWRKARNRNG